MKTLEDLEKILAEADRLVAKHDGIHKMHGARANLLTWTRWAQKDGIAVVDWDNVYLMIYQMRAADKAGFYPL